MNLIFALSPLLAVAAGALLLMLAEALGKPVGAAGLNSEGVVMDAGAGRAPELGLGSAVILLSGAVLSIGVWLVGPERLPGIEAVAPYFIVDRFSLFYSFVLCLGGALSCLLGGGYLPEHDIDRSEFFSLVLWSTVGAIALAAAGDLLTLFVGLETMSLGVYSMIALRRGSLKASEGALKYFLLGSFAAAIQLFGAGLLYGATGHTDLAGIGQAIRTIGAEGSTVSPTLVLFALVLSVVGLAFKVGAVPFHMWTPDAYEGAPTPTTTFMAVALKSAAFAILMRMLVVGFGDERLSSWGAGWPPIVAALAVLSMTVGNLVAGRQESVKRMLAYSSIAHAGYGLVGVAAILGSEQAEPSVSFYMLTYTVSTAGAFGALILCGSRGREAVSYEDLAGVGRRHPAAALAFSVFLLSLAGVPPLAGFFGKLYVFTAAVDAGLYWLTVVGLLNSVVGAYYYLRVMVYMYMREPVAGAAVAVPMRSTMVNAALLLAAFAVVFLGVFPTQALELAAAALP
jgi:NADH-quinone oxidoreductase subunit N